MFGAASLLNKWHKSLQHGVLGQTPIHGKEFTEFQESSKDSMVCYNTIPSSSGVLVHVHMHGSSAQHDIRAPRDAFPNPRGRGSCG